VVAVDGFSVVVRGSLSSNGG